MSSHPHFPVVIHSHRTVTVRSNFVSGARPFSAGIDAVCCGIVGRVGQWHGWVFGYGWNRHVMLWKSWEGRSMAWLGVWLWLELARYVVEELGG